MKKRILASILALAMVVTGITITKPEAKEVKAAEAVTNTDMLGIKMQARDNEDGTTDLRIVSSVDSLNYGEVGFQVWYGDAASNPKEENVTATFTTTAVLERIQAGVSYNFSPQVIDTSSKYFVTGTIKGIKSTNLGQNFYIKAFCTPVGGTTADREYGVGRFFNVNDATAASNINIPLAMGTVTAGTQLTDITVAGTTTQATVAAYLDGYAHLNVTVPSGYADKTALPSASIVAVGTNKTIYRNLESKLKVTESGSTVTVTGDDTWITKYLELYPSETEFVVANAADLYGLASYSQGNGLPGKTIYLVADIDANDGTGTASESEFTRSDGKTPYPWQPIGHINVKFQATFDGNMHTISGVYVNTNATYQGLFSVIYNTTIRNFKLENSYISTTAQNVGSVVGAGFGTISNIYSNAIVKGGNAFHGGIIGKSGNPTSEGMATELTIENCCFAGSIINTASGNGMGYVGGILGRVLQTVKLKNCLFAGSIDTTQMTTTGKAGNAGLVGVNHGTLSADTCAVLGTVSQNRSNHNVRAHLGDGSFSSIKNLYATNINGMDNCTNTQWYGNFSGAVPSDGAGQYTEVTSSVIGGAARTSLSKFDWVNDWRAIDGKLPIQKVFAEDYVDTDWYDTYKKEDQNYKLKTRQDLYGLAALVNAGVSFAGETVELANDITINTTDVLDFENTTPEYNWEAIGTASYPFKGILNGNGYSISGLYMNIASNYAGLFGVVNGATVQNLKVLDSYIAANGYLGSIAGQGSGTFTSIYSDATIETGQNIGGGIIGCTNAATTLNKCWFGGTVINNDTDKVNKSGGFVGGMIGWVNAGATSLTNCYTDGYLDVRNLGSNSGYLKAGGFVGAVGGSLTLTNCVNVSGLKADSSSVAAYSTVGYFNNNVTSSGVYSWNGTKDSNCVGWPGGYNSSMGTINYKSIDYSYKADAAVTKMPELDFDTVWQVHDPWPILRGVK